MRPQRARISSARAWTRPASVRSPQTAMVGEPVSAAISAATASSVVPSPKAQGEAGEEPCTATEAPSEARWLAMVRPMPRDEPVTQAILPANGRAACGAITPPQDGPASARQGPAAPSMCTSSARSPAERIRAMVRSHSQASQRNRRRAAPSPMATTLAR